MKFWQKAFVILLIVFIITIDLCVMVMMHFTYQQELQSLKKKSSGEAYFICTSISNDLYSSSPSGSMDQEERDNIFKTYMTYYKKQGVLLGFYEGELELQSNIPEHLFIQEQQIKEDKQYVYIVKVNEIKYLCVTSQLLAPYDQYNMVYAYSLADIEVSHQKLLGLTVFMMIIVTLLLVVLLSFILKRLTRPLKKLEERALAIGQGEYEGEVVITGKDEFAELAGRFNEMSHKIEEQIEALKEEDHKKQLLIDNMAHEFRTPLTSISGYASYLKTAVASEDERLEALEYIISESSRLQKLSKIILQGAEMREESQSFERVNVKELLEKVKDSTFVCATKKGATIKYEGKIESLQGNATLLESLLINLVENAIRACEEGKGQISVAIDQSEEGVCFKVTDNGIGMAKEEINKIAEPFYRIDKARSRKAGGVGLGVSLCQQIVNVHKGKMLYESEIGKGTTVYVTLFCKSL